MAYHHAYLRSQEVSLVIVSLPGLGGGGRGCKLQPVRRPIVHQVPAAHNSPELTSQWPSLTQFVDPTLCFGPSDWPAEGLFLGRSYRVPEG
jgi:hypothetical protein